MENDALFTDVIEWFPLLEALRDGALGRAAVEDRLDVSRATSYRVVNRLTEHGLLVESNGTYELTATGDRTLEAAMAFRTAVLEVLDPENSSRDRFIELIELTPPIHALGDDPLDRRDLESRLDVSNTTSYRFTRALEDLGLIEKTDGRYERTDAGDVVADALTSFTRITQTAATLAPVLEAVPQSQPPVPLEAFADATVTTLTGGDAYSQVNRFIALVDGTDMLRGIDLNSIDPLYIEEVTRLVMDGMVLETIDEPAVVEDTTEKYPYACVKLCVNGNVTPWVHDDLPFGVALFDDHVGIGVQGRDKRRLRRFVDTDNDRAVAWAEGLFESYRDESVQLEQFTKKGLKEALASREHA